MSIQAFLDKHKAEHLHVRKAVNLDDVGALSAQADDTIVFEAIDGYPEFRLVDQLFCHRKAQARVLRCQPSEVVVALVEVLRHGPRKLTTLQEGACQERVITGDDVDLSMLPIVTHTDQDPYPYATSFAIHRDPDTGQFNQMYPRCGVLGPREMVASFVTPTANRILAKHRAAGTRMPQAIVIGVDPAWELAGCYSHPHKDWWELELFEAISGRVGEVVKCKTVDLLVPADACIVIEGYCHPTRTAPDGPSPGPTMLFTPYIAQQPVFEVTAITMGRDLVYRNHQMTPFTDHQEMPRLFHEAIIHERLSAMGLKVHDVHFPSGGGSLMCLLQLEAAFDGQITDALLSTLGATWLNMKMVVAMDPDIDIHDPREVEYALATRVDPSKDVIIVPNGRAFPFDPSATPILEALADTKDTRFPSTVGKWGIDATKPAPYRKAERRNYQRAWPKNWGHVKLSDYLD